MPKNTETIPLHQFKTHLCHYLNRLQTGEVDDYTIRRYQKNIAAVVSLRGLKLRSDAADARARLNEHLNTQKRWKEERRMIDARLLSWPGVENFGRCRGN